MPPRQTLARYLDRRKEGRGRAVCVYSRLCSANLQRYRRFAVEQRPDPPQVTGRAFLAKNRVERGSGCSCRENHSRPGSEAFCICTKRHWLVRRWGRGGALLMITGPGDSLIGKMTNSSELDIEDADKHGRASTSGGHFSRSTAGPRPGTRP
jgi:hypothetical protein